MVGYRFWWLSIASVVLALTIVPAGWSQDEKPAPAAVLTCKVYSLADLSDDPNLCEWIADTVPWCVAPWHAKGTFKYYAPAKIMAVYHTPAAHEQVDEFLQKIRKALPTQKAAALSKKAAVAEALVMPAQFTVPGVGPVQATPSAYPVPSVVHAPKHLFHFIIRYEGEGIIDSNVIKFARAFKDKSPLTYYPYPAQVEAPQAQTAAAIGTSVGTVVGKAVVIPAADSAPAGTTNAPACPPPPPRVMPPADPVSRVRPAPLPGPTRTTDY